MVCRSLLERPTEPASFHFELVLKVVSRPKPGDGSMSSTQAEADAEVST
jgi:hypothetical protein